MLITFQLWIHNIKTRNCRCLGTYEKFSSAFELAKSLYLLSKDEFWEIDFIEENDKGNKTCVFAMSSDCIDYECL